MKISDSTYELLIPIADAIVGTVGILSVVDNGNGTYTLGVCDSRWATKGFPLTIQGNSYTIESVEPDVSITVSGTVLPTVGTFELYRPKFYHGTVESTISDLQRDVSGSKLSTDKLPMIWLREPVDETISAQEVDAILRKSECTLYFAIDSDFGKETNDDIFKYQVKPMRKLAQGFFNSMELSGLIDNTDLQDFRMTDYAAVATTMAKDGSVKNVFNMNLSGCKASPVIPFIRNQKNCCS